MHKLATIFALVALLALGGCASSPQFELSEKEVEGSALEKGTADFIWEKDDHKYARATARVEDHARAAARQAAIKKNNGGKITIVQEETNHVVVRPTQTTKVGYWTHTVEFKPAD